MQVEPETTASGKELINRLTPALKEGDLGGALEMVRRSWTEGQLVELLRHSNSDIRKVAALALGLVGDKEAVAPLAMALHDQDAMVTQMAEHALWSVWFKLGKCCAIKLVKQGSCHLSHGNYDVAGQKFTEAIDKDPEFAEAYNQRGITHYLAERYRESIADCKAALARMPQHFGAMAGMGHSHAHMHQWEEARHCYRLVLAIHPRLEGIQAALEQVEAIIAGEK